LTLALLMDECQRQLVCRCPDLLGVAGVEPSEPPESPGLWAHRLTLRVGARRPQAPQIAQVVPERFLRGRKPVPGTREIHFGGPGMCFSAGQE
jgi:hypothetical protein